jgi:hypothetical protein
VTAKVQFFALLTCGVVRIFACNQKIATFGFTLPMKIIKYGNPFPGAALFLAVGMLSFGCILLLFMPLGGEIAGAVLLVLGTFILVTKKEIWLDDLKGFRVVMSFLGIKSGKWNSFSDYRAMTVKYTVLSDKNMMARNQSLIPGAGVSGSFYGNQYNKEEAWVVKLIHKEKRKEPKLLLAGDKEKAIELIKELLIRGEHIAPYLSNYVKGFELSRDHLLVGQVVRLNS